MKAARSPNMVAFFFFRGARHTLRQLSQHDALDQVVQVTAEEFVSRFSPRRPGLPFCISLTGFAIQAQAKDEGVDIRRVTRCGMGWEERARERERTCTAELFPKRFGKRETWAVHSLLFKPRVFVFG